MGHRAKRAIVVFFLVASLAAWVLIPHPLEGPVLFTITDDHGVHLGDLLGLAVAGALLWWFAGRRGQGADGVDGPDRRQRSLQ